MKKKITVLLLCMGISAGMLCACGSSENGNASDTSSDEVSYDVIEYDALEYVTLGDYKNIEITLTSADYEVSKEDVENEMLTQIASHPIYKKTKKTTVKDDSLVCVDYKALVDGEEYEDAAAEDVYISIKTDSSGYPDGFVDSLVGHNVGDTFEVETTFAEDFEDASVAGEDVTFEVTINAIVKKTYPDLDTITDEYVSENFDCDTVDDFYNAVEEQLQQEGQENMESDIQREVIATLTDESEIKEVPAGLLEQRIAQYEAQFEAMASNYGMEVEDYLNSYYGMTVDEYEEKVKTSMEETVNQEMVLSAVAQTEGIEVDEEGYSEYISDVLEGYGFDETDELYSVYPEDYMRQLYLYYTKVASYLVQNADITYE